MHSDEEICESSTGGRLIIRLGLHIYNLLGLIGPSNCKPYLKLGSCIWNRVVTLNFGVWCASLNVLVMGILSSLSSLMSTIGSTVSLKNSCIHFSSFSSKDLLQGRKFLSNLLVWFDKFPTFLFAKWFGKSFLKKFLKYLFFWQILESFGKCYKEICHISKMILLHTDAFWSFSFQSTIWDKIFIFLCRCQLFL